MVFVITRKNFLGKETPYAVVNKKNIEDAIKKVGLVLLYPQPKDFPKPLVNPEDRHTVYEIHQVDYYR